MRHLEVLCPSYQMSCTGDAAFRAAYGHTGHVPRCLCTTMCMCRTGSQHRHRCSTRQGVPSGGSQGSLEYDTWIRAGILGPSPPLAACSHTHRKTKHVGEREAKPHDATGRHSCGSTATYINPVLTAEPTLHSMSLPTPTLPYHALRLTYK